MPVRVIACLVTLWRYLWPGSARVRRLCVRRRCMLCVDGQLTHIRRTYHRHYKLSPSPIYRQKYGSWNKHRSINFHLEFDIYSIQYKKCKTGKSKSTTGKSKSTKNTFPGSCSVLRSHGWASKRAFVKMVHQCL
jgi:hypothetical protein